MPALEGALTCGLQQYEALERISKGSLVRIGCHHIDFLSHANVALFRHAADFTNGSDPSFHSLTSGDIEKGGATLGRG
jgi:hypothetical protein